LVSDIIEEEMEIIIAWLLSALTILAASYLLPGVKVDNFIAALVTALVLGIVNAFIKPVLLILTLPINLLTLGLFTIVVNAILILLVDWIVPGFAVDGFLWALIFSLVLSLLNLVLDRVK
jgi:putative membrane protein